MAEGILIKVGMADLNIADGGAVLKTTGLGSCVGLTLFDPELRIGGMAHIMLPSSDIAREGQLNIAKYADTAVPELVRRLQSKGASLHRMVAKMAGGAQMFAFMGGTDTMRIGPRNVEATKHELDRFSIRLLSEDTGGNYGRTVELYSHNGIFLIRSVQHGVKEI
ncbi:chemotaxis protein CheD [Cohnella sp. LGH]|uniref:Probable chemoreceptor glutamine deamidase CheD n=1 Tax=Cohnella phaseoli TaxID=456490 RepID=A0A3D9KJR4_9BACL|nr:MULTISPECIES: chemotaxis protein CheD [Cohnella]QTH45883.1 chemotaxis protein CheD [Cohnella sp. LGH]RED86422.1 chemotaxis protein CheD [Cohnella phaseoli]